MFSSLEEFEAYIPTELMGYYIEIKGCKELYLHSLQCSRLLSGIGPRLGIEVSNDVKVASFFHDVGKIMVPSAVLYKRGRLTDSERREVEMHPLYGVGIINRAFPRESNLKSLCLAAQMHHEAWDGKGYPFHNYASTLPDWVQLLSIIDVYEALRAPRVYKPSFSHEQAIDIIAKDCGHKFNPRICSKLLEQDSYLAELYEK